MTVHSAFALISGWVGGGRRGGRVVHLALQNQCTRFRLWNSLLGSRSWSFVYITDSKFCVKT